MRKGGKDKRKQGWLWTLAGYKTIWENFSSQRSSNSCLSGPVLHHDQLNAHASMCSIEYPIGIPINICSFLAMAMVHLPVAFVMHLKVANFHLLELPVILFC